MPSKFIAGRSLTLPPGGLEGVAHAQGLNRPPLMVPSNTAGETIKIDSVDRAMTRTAPNFDP